MSKNQFPWHWLVAVPNEMEFWLSNTEALVLHLFHLYRLMMRVKLFRMHCRWQMTLKFLEIPLGYSVKQLLIIRFVSLAFADRFAPKNNKTHLIERFTPYSDLGYYDVTWDGRTLVVDTSKISVSMFDGVSILLSMKITVV
jgi:hypothetical protein